MLEIGSLVDGKYKILNVIGRGGMSVVYLAMNERANKQWAIKEVRKDGVQDYEVVYQSQVKETEMLKRLHHPHLPSIVDVIDGEGAFLIVMDYIEGRDLGHILSDEGAQPEEMVVEWGKQLCGVLGYLHSCDIIYRDMKPANVMLKPDGNVMIIDFGTARRYKRENVEDTCCLGTRGYAAPEQYGGLGQTDARTDIYCLGSTLYHMVTGDNPTLHSYKSFSIRSINPALSEGLEEIILKCTEENPEDRYQSCEELLYALEHVEEGGNRARRIRHRKLGFFVASAAITVLLGTVSLTGKILENRTEKSGYDSYLERAGSSVDKTEKFSYCEKAISLNPIRKEGYDMLIDIVEEDAILDESEYQTVKKILDGGSSNVSNINQYKNNPEGYFDFCWDFGKDCYFSYSSDGSVSGIVGNRSYAQSWLQTVKDQDVESIRFAEDGEQERALAYQQQAVILAKICGYTGQLGMTDRSGNETGVSYLDYWNDLNSLLSQQLQGQSNKVPVLLLYDQIAYSVMQNISDFTAAGVSIDAVQMVLDDCVASTNAVTPGEKDYTLSEMKASTLNILQKAEEAVDVARNYDEKGGYIGG